jgi:uncharacterized protein YdeI (YjbR/CyaY-like superfamily)
MEMTGDPVPFPTPDAWRSWLEEHHASEDDVWMMIAKKHAGVPSITLPEAMKEALCFGWIDSAMQPIDGEWYALRFTPRRTSSNWSARNRGWALQLIEEGRMTGAGLAKIEEAKRTGRWDDAEEGAGA